MKTIVIPIFVMMALVLMLGCQRDAVEGLRAKAVHGDAEAQFCLSKCYMGGNGVTRDIEEGMKWLRKAAEQGFAEAQYSLGCYYLDGEGGLEKNPEEAVRWWQKAAAQGHQDSKKMLHLLGMFKEGENVGTSLTQ